MPRTLLIVTVGLLSFYYYLATVPPTCGEYCLTLHREIIAHSAESPYRYRILAAYLVELFAGDRSDVGITYGYMIGHLVALPLMLIVLDRWLRVWLSHDLALVGVLLVAALLPLMFGTWGISLYSALEVIFLAAGLFLLIRQPPWFVIGFCGLIIVATLNRETAILLPLSYIATRMRDHGYTRAVLFLAIWAIIFVGLRVILGSAPDQITPIEAWRANIGGGWWTWQALTKIPFFLPLGVLYIVRLRHVQTFLARLAPLVVVYLLLYMTFGLWHEVRLLLPLLVLILPVALSAIRASTSRKSLAH